MFHQEVKLTFLMNFSNYSKRTEAIWIWSELNPMPYRKGWNLRRPTSWQAELNRNHQVSFSGKLMKTTMRSLMSVKLAEINTHVTIAKVARIIEQMREGKSWILKLRCTAREATWVDAATFSQLWACSKSQLRRRRTSCFSKCVAKVPNRIILFPTRTHTPPKYNYNHSTATSPPKPKTSCKK